MIALVACLTLAQAGTPTVPEDVPLSATAPGLNPADLVGPPEGPILTDAALDAATAATAGKLRCPTCQGMSVGESPAEGARAMKLEVRKLVGAGYSERQVLDFFEAAYGEFIRLDPHKRGLNLALWIAPAGLLIGGLVILFGRMGKTRQPPPAPTPPGTDPYLERVRREIDS